MLERLECVLLTESLSRNVMKKLRTPTSVYPWHLRTVNENSVRIRIQLDFFVLAMKSFCCFFVIIVLLVVLLLWFLLLLETQRKYTILLLFRCVVKDTHTCPHLPPLRRQRRAAHDDIFADRTVVIVATAPPEFHWCLSHILHQQTSRRSRGSCSNQRQV